MSHRPRERFGQHFLHDPVVIDRIVRAINPHDDADITQHLYRMRGIDAQGNAINNQVTFYHQLAGLDQ